MKILLHISFVGTNYCGYQVQPNGVSVQQKLNEAAKALFGYDCDIVGCSRTDSGVHANEFCATIAKRGENALQTDVPLSRIPQALSAHLPWDICVFEAKWVEDSFHPRYDVKEKEYLYRIINTPIYDPFDFGRAWFVPRKITDDGLERMNEAAKNIIGKRDFSAFMSEGSDTEDTVRNVTSLTVERRGDLVEIKICADGFLYNMVRIIDGTLLEVAFGRFSPDYVAEVVASENRQKAGPTAPPDGLYLNRVIY